MADIVPQKTETIQLKRGMKSFEPEGIKLKFADYVVEQKLPTLPKTFGHVHAAAPPGGWGMLGNDQYGDCVMAGAAHETMLFAWASKHEIPAFSTDEVVRQYLELSGGQDEGLDPVEAASWRRRTGITDANGKAHKIDAYVRVTTLEQLDMAVYLFGAAAMCWWLPSNAEHAFAHAQPWTDTSNQPDPNAGHYTPYAGKNSHGQRLFLTWGRVQAASEEFCRKYMVPQGCIAYLSREYLLDSGQSPEAIAWNDLQSDLQQVTRA